MFPEHSGVLCIRNADRDSSVGIATRYRLESPEIEFRRR
jgi:hypothetical protein